MSGWRGTHFNPPQACRRASPAARPAGSGDRRQQLFLWNRRKPRYRGAVPIEPSDANLQAILRAVQTTDWSLLRLIRFADQGLGVAVTLVVDGLIVKGVLTRAEEWAATLDGGMDEALRLAAESKEAPAPGEAGKVGPGDIEELRATLQEASFTRMVEQRREGEERIDQELQAHAGPGEEGDFYDLPESLARDLIDKDQSPQVLTVRDATFSVPGGGTAQIPMLRVLTSHVSVWFLGI